jgi:hypothetical protein
MESEDPGPNVDADGVMLTVVAVLVGLTPSAAQ